MTFSLRPVACTFLLIALGICLGGLSGARAAETTKKIVFLAGPPSHGYAAHEHNAGCKLLAKWLHESVPGVEAIVYRNQWPTDPAVLENAAAIVIFSDGGQRNLAMGHLDELERLMKQGVGLGCLHYAVEVPKGEPGDDFLRWIGGYFETDWSVNPTFVAEFKSFPQHPVTRGVKPFAIQDEWYYHMRFPVGMKNVTPVLTCIPPDATRERPDGSHSNNPTVRAEKGHAEHVAWVIERPDGGRGFGFTGGHFHWNWAHPSFRKLVLNAILWIAKIEVPQDGVQVATPTLEELQANLDPKPQPKAKGKGKAKPQFDRQKVIEMIEGWQK